MIGRTRNGYGGTLGPRESTEKFSLAWSLSAPISRDQDFAIYEVPMGKSDGYSSLVRQMFERAMEGAHVTEPCKEFLRSMFYVSLRQGVPPVRWIPVEKFGIDLSKERYGIFGPEENLGEIEGELIRFHVHIIEAYRIPELRERGMELNRRWRRDWNERYG